MSDWLRGARKVIAGLRPVKVPDAPARAFRDLWPGDAARGHRLLRGECEVYGTTRPLTTAEEGGQGWAEGSGAPPWRAAVHGFAWLRDLRALGTDGARLRARDLTADWMAQGSEQPLAALPEVVGARLSAWLGHWDFLAATAEDGFRRALMVRLAQDARGLVASLPAEARHRGGLAALKGALAASVALAEEAWVARCLRVLPQEIERQILPDGAHVERSPGQLLLAVQDLIEIRNLLHGAGLEAPPHLALALDRAAPALRLFRHGDGGLALFNGTRDEGAALVDLVLTQGQARGRAPLILPEAGFQRLQAGRTLVIADCGAPPEGRGSAGPGGLPRHPDRYHHAGTLAFEMSVGRDRLIVNCGAAPAAESAWRDALRATAAHSTLVLADTNSSELREEGLGRRPEAVEAERQEANGAQWLDASHDGYRRGFGALHRRRLYLSESGDDLRGEDSVEAEDIPAYAVRFHLHPGVVASPQQEENAVLLRLPSGASWRLRASRARLTVEESVFMAGEPRRTSQVVLSAEPGTASVQWALSRVNLPNPTTSD
ncbi:heparinase II/III family protein [Pseudoroseomonas cervicalis]|uniref:heparinase II/III family protein n=1 Tax=Teichococcus cervicalis TaxID=204525 RepID=UPI00277D4905|nr:heparinase II/III family protein [Pseudoroseomonas cervicalis]MDQ1080854.1 putative heparinase superfamily protein [Pseudoroseomonas cervicalis]